MSDNRVYFKNLNGVRFLAALVVIIHHIEMGKFWLGQPNIYKNSFVGGVFGQLGIILFFVLSGFLITYLLLEEHRRSGTISIKSFYMRRILRIWPVYYLIIILSFFVFPHFDFFFLPSFSEHINESFWIKAGLYLSFLPNLGYTLYTHIAYATQTWSVGVEEQFYLIWPVLMLWAIKKKK
ncbi:MAG: acyltransferase, partial [Chitinophagaceae bacterium]|nr:acyltransferase [Chitinophagaceae bacterium]